MKELQNKEIKMTMKWQTPTVLGTPADYVNTNQALEVEINNQDL